jgi:hypothetical protein
MRQLLWMLLMIFLGTFSSALCAQSRGLDSLLQQYNRHWEMARGLYRVMKDGSIGVVNDQGQIVVPCRFDQVWTPSGDHYLRVLLDLKTGLYHLEKGIIVPAEYDQIWEFENGLAKVMKNRKFGYVNSDGLMIVPCEYQHIWSPRDGRMKVINDGLTGFLGTDGNVIVPVIYQYIRDYENGFAQVVRNGKMGYVDTLGNEVVPAMYDQVWPFEDGEATIVKNGAYFKVNRQGKIIETTSRPRQNALNADSTKEAGNTNDPRIRIEKDFIDIRHEWRNNQTPKHKEHELRPYFQGHLAGAGLGMNGYLDSDYREELPENYGFMALNQSKSLEVSVYPFEKSLGLIGGWLGITTGIGLQYNNYRFNMKTAVDVGEPGREWFPEISENAAIFKSKLMMLHANVPVLVELQIPDRQNDNAFFISGGVVGGVKLQSHTKLVFHDNDNGRQKKKKRGDMGLPVFRYGYMAMAGYGTVSLYAAYYPEPMFKRDEGPDIYPFSVGLMFNFN